ncbi:Rid family hydrolase [Bosea sp. 685]|uniref:Rid family hydrolase n=1 Tax=Bosea sp. 685 TaxID=3080057 RepID=UPI00289334FB|nr:Rid family hydrolase [Bosea sp. 685]WNJ93821.1 Rid family hydrolase [Bosea sp. 685]
MTTPDITRIPNKTLPSKSAVAVYHLPGGGGFLWAVATSPDRRQDIKAQTLGTQGVLEIYLRDAGLDRTRIVKAEIVVTDHDNKPAFDEAWSSWMPAGSGPVRSFVQSVMPEGDLIEIIITAALLPPTAEQQAG